MARATDSDEVFLSFGGSSGKREKKVEEGVNRPFIGELNVGRGLGLGPN
jgi:hypothetical protein